MSAGSHGVTLDELERLRAEATPRDDDWQHPERAGAFPDYTHALLSVADDLLKIARAMAVSGGVYLDDDAQECYCNTCGKRHADKAALQHESYCAWVMADALAVRSRTP